MMTKMVGFDWPEGKSKHVCYFTPNGNIGELSVGVGGSWQIAALMALAKAPLAAEGDIAGYAWPTSGSLQGRVLHG
jgi:hypothetical protein